VSAATVIPGDDVTRRKAFSSYIIHRGIEADRVSANAFSSATRFVSVSAARPGSHLLIFDLLSKEEKDRSQDRAAAAFREGLSVAEAIKIRR